MESLNISVCPALERVFLYNPINPRKLKADTVWKLKRIEGLEKAAELKNVETDNDGSFRTRNPLNAQADCKRKTCLSCGNILWSVG